MKKTGKLLIAALVCLLLPAIIVSCVEKEPEAIDSLCNGYWQTKGAADKPLMSFDESGSIAYYEYRYESCEDTYYACRNSNESNYTRYTIDIKNATICFLPNMLFYDIYVLTDDMVMMGAPEDDKETIRIEKISCDRIEVLSTSEFRAKYPFEEAACTDSVFE